MEGLFMEQPAPPGILPGVAAHELCLFTSLRWELARGSAPELDPAADRRARGAFEPFRAEFRPPENHVLKLHECTRKLRAPAGGLGPPVQGLCCAVALDAACTAAEPSAAMPPLALALPVPRAALWAVAGGWLQKLLGDLTETLGDASADAFVVRGPGLNAWGACDARCDAVRRARQRPRALISCLLYTSDAADE